MLIKLVSFQKLLDCFNNDFENDIDNVWNLEHNEIMKFEILLEILNRAMQRIMSIITSSLLVSASINILQSLQSSSNHDTDDHNNIN